MKRGHPVLAGARTIVEAVGQLILAVLMVALMAGALTAAEVTVAVVGTMVVAVVVLAVKLTCYLASKITSAMSSD